MSSPIDQQRLGRLAAILAILTATATLLLAGIVHDSFSITTHSLSSLGSPGTASSPLFNNGLIIAGILGSMFGLIHARNSRNRIETAGSLLYLITSFNLALIGLYPVGTSLHMPLSVSFFLLLSYTLFLHGTGTIRSGITRGGLISIWLGIIHATSWLLWAVLLDAYLAIAAPEIVGTIIIGGWTLWQAQTIQPQR